TITLTVPVNNQLPTLDAAGVSVTVVGGGFANYGTIAHGASASQNINFTVPPNAACDVLTITININSSLGAASGSFRVRVGQPITVSENFDSLTAPALPASWSTAQTGAGAAWVTSTTTPPSAPNDAFTPDATSTRTAEHVHPPIPITSASAQLSFQNLYNTEESFDGMVLEISDSAINGGAFQDITNAGGSFVSGEYSGILGTGSPLSGRAAWTGLSAGTPAAPAYINTVVNLPATANGHSIRLRFRVVADSNTVAPGVPGVRIDTITLTTGSQCGAATPTPTPTPTPTATPTPTPSPSPTPSCGTTNLFQ